MVKKPTYEELELRIEKLEHVAQELTKSEQQFRWIAENINEVFYIKNPRSGLYEYVNPVFETIFGLSREKLYEDSRHLFDVVVHPDDRERVNAAIQRQTEHSEWFDEQYRILRFDGTIGWVWVRSFPVFDEQGQVNRIVGIAEDITGRKQAEERQKEVEEHFRSITEVARDAIISVDKHGNIIQWNRAAETIYGYSEGEILGKSVAILMPERFREHFTRAVEQLSTPQYSHYFTEATYEFQGQRKDGSEFPAELSFATWQMGTETFYTTINRDITWRKQAEEEHKQLYEHEKKLRQETEANINRRIEFTRVLVHELKTPITPVLASCELLLEELNDESLLPLAKNISNGASNLNKIIDELLDMVKGEIGILQLNPEWVYLQQLLQEIASNVTPLAMRRGQNLSLELPASLPAIWADEKRLQQVILNLLNNAFKFTPTGGKITLRSREDGNNLIVEVEDTGRGISKQEQGIIFEPYQQLTSDGSHLSGLGLGLSLSKRLIKLHGGQIWVKSQAGRGSTFGFSVPIKAAGTRENDVETGQIL